MKSAKAKSAKTATVRGASVVRDETQPDTSRSPKPGKALPPITEAPPKGAAKRVIFANAEAMKVVVSGARSVALEGIAGLISGKSMMVDHARRAGSGVASATRGTMRIISNAMGNRQEDVLGDLAKAAEYRTISNRFRTLADLSAREQQAVADLDRSQRQIYQSGSELAIQGEPVKPMWIVSGWAYRVRVTSKGRRQVTGVLLPGDGFGLRGDGEPLSISTIFACSTVKAVDPASFLQKANATHFPGLAHAMRRAATQEEMFAQNQIVRLGARGRTERLVNLMMELRWRLAQVGLATDAEFPLPLSAESLSDVLAMPAGAVRSSFAKLSLQGLMKVRMGRGQAAQTKVLNAVGDFTPPDVCSCTRMRMAPISASDIAPGDQLKAGVGGV